MTEIIAHRADSPPMSEAEQAAFFAETLARAHQAEARVGVRERFIAVADATVRLVFAGEALERALYPAVAHLSVQATAAPDATFHVWDTESSGVEAPPAPCGRDCYTDRGDICGMTSARWRSAFHWAEFSLNLMDTATGEAVYWVRTPSTLPYWTKASPFRTLFHWLMEPRGKQLLHAAVVSTDDGAVLIVGRGGVGKSSTALACLEAGFGYVGDDYVVVGLDPEPCAFSLYGTAKLEPHQAGRFPGLESLIAAAPVEGEEKAVLRLHPARAEQIATRAPLRAILTPRFGDGGPTRFEPVDVATLSRATAFTTLAQLPHAGLATHDFIGRLIARVPARTIVLSREQGEIAGAIAGLLADPPEDVAVSRAGVSGHRPLMSVIVPVHNGARFLRDAVDSILNQAWPRIEIIVVDDGSTDEIEQAVRELPVDVRFLRQNNRGAAAARNRGYREAAGDLIAFLDVDDFWPEGALDAMAERLLDADLDVAQGHGQTFRRETEGDQLVGDPNEAFPYYIGAAVYRRSALEAVGLFDESLTFSEDTDWFARAREAGLATERLDQITLMVRRHETNMTRGKTLVELHALRVFKKVLDRRRMDTGKV